MPEPRVVAIVVNWNGWADTLACLDSLHETLAGPPLDLLVCDNGSTNESGPRIADWLQERVGPAAAVDPVQPADGTALRFRPLDAAGGSAPLAPAASASVLRSVHVLTLSRNFGYAGAINRCIAWAREALAPDYVWMLNNDLAFEPGTLHQLLAALQETPAIGLCGSVLMEWDPPPRVQAIGGIFHWPIGIGSHLQQLPASVPPQQNAYFDIDYPVGASMLASRDFLERVGLMDEGYFLYFEEMDWAERGRAQGFRPAVALQSRLRHKEGASTGSQGGLRHKSLLSEHYGTVNRLRFIRKFRPVLLPLVWASLFVVVLERLAHGEWRRGAFVLRRMFTPGGPPP